MQTINDRDFIWLVEFVRNRFGINLEHKRQLINARLSFDIKRRGYTNFASYIYNIKNNPDSAECSEMINRLSTNYTFFFREPDYIERIQNVVLREFTKKGVSHIRIWDAACSSGEEAYSVAMVLENLKVLFNKSFDYKIHGTDINTKMLEIAEKGIYSSDEFEHIPQRYKHFTTAHSLNEFEICASIRQNMTWQYQNLLDETSESDSYDIIFCRNVMIYFTPELRQKMTGKLYKSLIHGGYLFTGATESIDLERKYFSYIAPTFYQKK